MIATLSALDILTMPLSELAVKCPTPENVRNDIQRRSRRLSENRARAQAKRKNEQMLKEQLLSTGGGWMLAYLCENQEPDANAPRGLVARPLPPQDAIYDARFDGRYFPDCEFQGIKRYASKEKATYRAYRFLATDFINNFGGLDTSKSKLGTCFSHKVETAQRSWQMCDPADMSAEDIARGQRPRARFAKKRCADERIQDWSSGKETFDFRPYRGPSHEEEVAKSNAEWAAELARVQIERKQSA